MTAKHVISALRYRDCTYTKPEIVRFGMSRARPIPSGQEHNLTTLNCTMQRFPPSNLWIPSFKLVRFLVPSTYILMDSGGPATDYCTCWITDFINYCNTNNVPFDFISTHCYSGGNTDVGNVTNVVIGLQEARKLIGPSTPFLVTEWSSSYVQGSGAEYNVGFYHDEPDQAAFLLAAVDQVLMFVHRFYNTLRVMDWPTSSHIGRFRIFLRNQASPWRIALSMAGLDFLTYIKYLSAYCTSTKLYQRFPSRHIVLSNCSIGLVTLVMVGMEGNSLPDLK